MRASELVGLRRIFDARLLSCGEDVSWVTFPDVKSPLGVAQDVQVIVPWKGVRAVRETEAGRVTL